MIIRPTYLNSFNLHSTATSCYCCCCCFCCALHVMCSQIEYYESLLCCCCCYCCFFFTIVYVYTCQIKVFSPNTHTHTHGVSSGPININRHLHTWAHFTEFQTRHANCMRAYVIVIFLLLLLLLFAIYTMLPELVCFYCFVIQTIEMNSSYVDFPTIYPAL